MYALESDGRAFAGRPRVPNPSIHPVISKLNLASKPFNNRSLPWTVITLVVFLSLVAFVFIIRATEQARAQANAVNTDIITLKGQEEGLRKQAEAIKSSLTSGQLQTLGAAHELIDRKHFSWSRLFSDLEGALPGNVRVTRISVRDVSARGDQTIAELEMTVASKLSTAITAMLGDMDRAGIFQAEIRSQNAQKGRGESGMEYELYVLYRPRPGVPLAEARTATVASAASSKDPGVGGVR